MAPAASLLLVTLCAASQAQLFPRSDYGSSTNYNSVSNSNYGSNYAPSNRADYNSGLNYGNIYDDRPPSGQTYVVPPSRSPHLGSRHDDTNRRLQHAYDAYLRELRAVSAQREAHRGEAYAPHDLQTAAHHSGHASAAPVERSDSYGHESYGYGSDCSGLDTLSLVLGLGALAAFAAYYFIQQQAMARGLSETMFSSLQSRYPEPVVLEMLTEGTCRALDDLESRRRRRQEQDGGVTGRAIDSECLEDLIGPAAGFFALAAIVAYALAQAAMAMARSLDAGLDSAVLNTAARQMLLALTAQDECVTWELCQVTRSATQAAPPAQTPIKLASVALAWYAARLRQGPSSEYPGPYSEYCWSLVDGLRGSCPAPRDTCVTS